MSLIIPHALASSSRDELTYIDQGTGSRLVGDHIGSYHNDDLVLLGSNLPHTWASDAFRDKSQDRHPAIVVQFDINFLGLDFLLAPELTGISALIHRASQGISYPPEIARPIGQRLTSMVDMSGAERLFGLLLCLHELAETNEGVLLSSDSYEFTASPVGATRIQTVCDYIARHLSDPELDQIPVQIK